MGTSISSSGPGSGVPLIPPWVNDLDTAAPMSPEDEQEAEDDAKSPQQVNPEIAPTGRFKGARSNLGQFARSGSSDGLNRGLGHYVRKGLGGSRRARQRMAGTARKAGALYGVLHALSSGTSPAIDLGINATQLAGRPAREIVDRIVEALSPSDGTHDVEASRRSISCALCELITIEPMADLTALTQEQIELAMQLFIGEDICRRIELDVGQAILDNAPDPPTAIGRLAQMCRYVKQAVAASFRRQKVSSRPLTQQAATRLASRVIQDTFEVFESYLT